MVRTFIAALMGLTAASSASAQSQSFVEAGPMAALQHSSASRSFEPTAPDKGIGGKAYGFTLGGGWAGDWGVFVEAAIPQYFDVDWVSYLFLSRGRYRDMTVSGLACICRFRPVELAIGLSYVRQQMHREVSPTPAGSSSTTSFVQRRSSSLLGITAGASVPARISGRVDVVPRIRVHFIDRNDGDFSLRLGGVLVQPSVSLRLMV